MGHDRVRFTFLDDIMEPHPRPAQGTVWGSNPLSPDVGDRREGGWAGKAPAQPPIIPIHQLPIAIKLQGSGPAVLCYNDGVLAWWDGVFKPRVYHV